MIQSGNATLLQRFPKDCFVVDVAMSKCLHATSSNALFCTHYVGNMNYRSLITVTFPIHDRFNRKNDNAMLEYTLRRDAI